MTEQSMMNRRRFCLSIVSVLSGTVLPGSPESLSSASIMEVATSTNSDILALETALKVHSGTFSFYLHNELRHLYWTIGNERKSREHADVILKYMPMNDYILHTLSDWQLTDWQTPANPKQAVERLLRNAEQYNNLPHVWAACLVKAGAILTDLDDHQLAASLYEDVLSSQKSYFTATLKPYYQIAQVGLLV